jgi:cytochrome bd ubiquinol oxidase subunit II
MPDPSFLQVLWFGLIGVLWIGYFILEGFDFGVGILLRTVARDEPEKRAVIHTIGPVWDGNEVWLLVAGGATFAAFPGWYASLFSGFYLALLLILIALIIRGVSFEFWGKSDSPRWRATWEWTTIIGSGGAALLWGVGFANIVHGVPMGPNHNVTASLWDLLHPYALLGGLVTLSLFTAHGAMFLTLRTKGGLVERSRAVARKVAPVAVLLMAGFVAWTASDQSSGGLKWSGLIVTVAAVLCAALAAWQVTRERDAVAFSFSAVGIALLFLGLFIYLFPNALPSTTNPAYDLTLVAASSTHYTLTVMTVVAIFGVPIVLAYTAWTYWVFRHRLGREDFAGDGQPTPMAVIEQKLGGPPSSSDGNGTHAPPTTA